VKKDRQLPEEKLPKLSEKVVRLYEKKNELEKVHAGTGSKR
jgi:hypothetical protein